MFHVATEKGSCAPVRSGKKTTRKERNATRRGRRRRRGRGKYPHGSAGRGLDREEMSASISAFGILEIFI